MTASKVDKLIAAHRVAYDKWELASAAADTVPRKSSTDKANDAAMAVERAAFDALFSCPPRTLEEVAAVAAHLAPLEKAQTLPRNTFSRLLHSLSRSVTRSEFGTAGTDPQFLEQEGTLARPGWMNNPGEVLQTKLQSSISFVVALMNTFDDQLTDTLMPPKHMHYALFAVNELLDEAQGAARRLLSEQRHAEIRRAAARSGGAVG